MCLVTSEQETENLKRRFFKNKKTFYKVVAFKKTRGELIARSPIRNKKIEAGWYKSNLTLEKTVEESLQDSYEKGIHVYTKVSIATGYVRYWSNPSYWHFNRVPTFYCVVKVTGYKKDFIAASRAEDGEAVFTKVFISKAELNRAKGLAMREFRASRCVELDKA
jgi:hypothetical protein